MDKKDSTNNDMLLFGVDFGLKKIGIAIGQNVTKRASPLTIIYNKKDVINWDELEKIIKKWSPKVLIVGQPVVRKENNFTKALDTFNKELSKRYLILFLSALIPFTQ